MASTPAKRRALAPLDANANSPVVSRSLSAKPASGLPELGLPPNTPTSKRNTQQRPLAREEPPAKKLCTSPVPAPPTSRTRAPSHDQTEARPDQEPSRSPEDSSIFDTSAADASAVTAATDPDAPASVPEHTPPQQHPPLSQPPPPIPPPASRSRPLAREQARQKAEVLRLRLGLARYKLQTGQEDVPLERLERRPLPANKNNTQQLPPLYTPPQSQERNKETRRTGTEAQEAHEAQGTPRSEGLRKALPTGRSQSLGGDAGEYPVQPSPAALLDAARKALEQGNHGARRARDEGSH